MRVTSLDGLCIVGYRGLHPDLIYVDSDHSFEAVVADFACAMELFPQAAIVGDDWGSKSVREAVTVVAKRCGVTIEARRNAWRLVDRLNQRQAAEQVDRVRGDRLRPGDAERSAAEGKAMIAIPPRLPAH